MRLLRYLLLCATTLMAVSAVPLTTPHPPDIAWDRVARAAFYAQDQGSRVMPMAWAKALKQPDGTAFLADALTRYGYLVNDTEPSLPIGFLQSTQDGVAWLGMTCAACHTRDITFGGQSHRIDGGPAFADFQSFATDLNAAVAAVLPGQPGFPGFADSVLGAGSGAPARSLLGSQLREWHDAYDLWVSAMPTNPKQRWGPARMDAVGMIFNRVTALDLGPPPHRLIPTNIAMADAPVRYPFLWNASKQDFTQWARFAPNGDDIAAVMRNVGQVYGVFGRFTPQREPDGTVDYLSGNSLDFERVWQVERLVRAIPVPRYEAAFPGGIDAKLAADGKVVFKQSGCITCHDDRKSGEWRLASAWATGPSPLKLVGTDTRQLDQLGRSADSGVMEGASIIPPLRRLSIVVPDVSVLAPVKRTDQALKILTVAVAGTVAQEVLRGLHSLMPGTKELLDEVTAHPIRAGRDFTASILAASQQTHVYEARALYGVWAAAPYLHNGSVPTLADLLKPPAERPPVFPVGPAYDPGKVGLAGSQAPSAFNLVTTGCEDIKSGYSRCGHEYGTGLSETKKKALLEYLKGL